MDQRIARLALLYGIQTKFWDWQGKSHAPCEATVIACLQAQGVDTTAPGWVELGLAQAEERPWHQVLPSCVVVEEHQDKVIEAHVRAGHTATLQAHLEDGSILDVNQVDNAVPDRQIGDQLIGRATFQLPTDIEPGYHRLVLTTDGQTHQTSYIVTPAWVGLAELEGWGFAAQLYSFYGQASWGLGDLVDLKDLARWAKKHHNADFVLINPVHAAEVVSPLEPSPYYPATRRYINPIYVRPEAIDELAEASAAVRADVQVARMQAVVVAEMTDRVPREAVWVSKRGALKAIFELPRDPRRQRRFENYLAREGTRLQRYATWCALSELHGPNWRDWPEKYQSPDSAAIKRFVREHPSEIEFHSWLQWVAHQQAKQAQKAAKRAGMKIGIMADLAVGVSNDGEETWATPDLFAKGVTVGAPPDEYNQAGQDWRQPPWRPDRLRAMCYTPLREMVSQMLRHAGALRIDHIIGMFRLWWIPEGSSPEDGAYVQYDHEAMIGILALEASRAQAPIIGEDLGTVEPWVRDYLARRGIYGTSVLWFENGEDGGPLAPERWRELCLASVTTHDLPPTLGYLAHDHIALRHQLGLLTESLESAKERDESAQSAVLTNLAKRGMIKRGQRDPRQIMLGLHRFLAQTPARL
ncbi:MAG: 4-alpha-glucanotransferase, partial [Propionibacteriaceae bacterium]|nr:4-alpha-glucanotransferase [Propionibacteriaceae bacterium]